MPRILVVEDDRDLREALCDTLELADFEAVPADCAEEALKLLMLQSLDMVITDVNMPGMDGHALLAQIKLKYPQLPVVIMTAFGSVDRAVGAMKAGAVDYLLKPFEPGVLISLLQRVVSGVSIESAGSQPVAVDPSSQQLLGLARRVASVDSTVLVSGESGTGKEVLAQYIHQHSSRANKAFIAINCAAIPENMLEATLFGHEKGAFTGAHAAAPGKFEQANGGTLLLDEISEMDLALQAKLLRVLQEREVERVGGRKTIKLDVRVIATTNRNMLEEVQRGGFREDLYYRLCVFPLQWLPLRERPADIVPLAQRLIQMHSQKMSKAAPVLDATACAALQSHAWPGNVRELDNVVQRALILQQGAAINVHDLCLLVQQVSGGAVLASMSGTAPQALASVPLEEAGVVAQVPITSVPVPVPLEDSAVRSLDEGRQDHEFQMIIDVLKSEQGKRKQAAERLGVSARTLRYKLAKMRDAGIDLERALA